MKLTKSQKVYVAVMCLSLACLAIDRLWLGGAASSPATAEAAPLLMAAAAPEIAAGPEATPAAAQPVPSIQIDPGPSLAERLETLATDHEVPVADIGGGFLDAPDWISLPAEPVRQAAPAISRAEQFAARHQLSGVLVGRQGLAMVDGRAVRVGQKINGFKLINVTEKAARFSDGEEVATLALQANQLSP